MADQQRTKLNSLAPDEKVTPVTVYMMTGLAIGKLITKEQIRVSTWLRTDMAPDYVSLYEARFLSLSGSEMGTSLAFSELHISATQVLAFHLLPPTSDPLDYDPKEPHRKMEPVSAVSGFFRFDGLIRMSTYSTLGAYLDVTKEAFTPLYEVQVISLAIPTLTPIRVPYALVRQAGALFGTRV
jgi:hypothetical protein